MVCVGVGWWDEVQVETKYTYICNILKCSCTYALRDNIILYVFYFTFCDWEEFLSKSILLFDKLLKQIEPLLKFKTNIHQGTVKLTLHTHHLVKLIHCGEHWHGFNIYAWMLCIFIKYFWIIWLLFELPYIGYTIGTVTIILID